MYWVNGRSIEKAEMDGNNREYVHNSDTSAHQLNALTLDTERRLIYWIELHEIDSTIYSSGLNENLTNVSTVYTSENEQTIDNMDIYNNVLYLSLKNVPFIQLSNGSISGNLLRSELACANFRGIKVVAQEKQPIKGKSAVIPLQILEVKVSSSFNVVFTNILIADF